MSFPPHSHFIDSFSYQLFLVQDLSYTPSASALVADLAPESLRGVYLSLNSQCWAIGYFLGPTLGGWALDRSATVAHSFWLVCAVSIAIGILILQYLNTLLVTRDKVEN